ncbi:MAG TPA: hypothetical protein PKL84_19180, partial [Candidatus Hydrogenedentes bacterium]|nr:hypothetical protein [Candidatus Hydrogenedentota bacterium]
MRGANIRYTVFLGISLAVVGPVFGGPIHTADRDGDRCVSLSELLRVVQFFNSRAYHCDTEGED